MKKFFKHIHGEMAPSIACTLYNTENESDSEAIYGEYSHFDTEDEANEIISRTCEKFFNKISNMSLDPDKKEIAISIFTTAFKITIFSHAKDKSLRTKVTVNC